LSDSGSCIKEARIDEQPAISPVVLGNSARVLTIAIWIRIADKIWAPANWDGEQLKMTLEERSSLVLALAGVLFANGQSTAETMAGAGRFGESLGLRATLVPGSDELQLEVEDGDQGLICAAAADSISDRRHAHDLDARLGDHGPSDALDQQVTPCGKGSGIVVSRGMFRIW
jgi:hypothetical protein